MEKNGSLRHQIDSDEPISFPRSLFLKPFRSGDILIEIDRLRGRASSGMSCVCVGVAGELECTGGLCARVAVHKAGYGTVGLSLHSRQSPKTYPVFI